MELTEIFEELTKKINSITHEKNVVTVSLPKEVIKAFSDQFKVHPLNGTNENEVDSTSCLISEYHTLHGIVKIKEGLKYV